jgi:hypothetical protein
MPDPSHNELISSPQDLDELAGVIRAADQGVAHAAGNLIERALTAGDALLKAKEKVGHGNWLSWLKTACDLSEDRAERYMRLARGRGVLEANSARVRNLSLTGAVGLIKEQEPSRPRDTVNKTKPATSFNALGWWSTAPLEQRRHFLDGAGRASIREAQPSAWLDGKTDDNTEPDSAGEDAPKTRAEESDARCEHFKAQCIELQSQVRELTRALENKLAGLSSEQLHDELERRLSSQFLRNEQFYSELERRLSSHFSRRHRAAMRALRQELMTLDLKADPVTETGVMTKH